MRKILPVLAALALSVVAAGAYLLYSREKVVEPPTAVARVLSVTPDDLALGRADAPVTIVEYASLTCPHCARFHVETLPSLKSAYIDAGKVRLVYRDFPLDGIALRAAMLAHCAGRERYFGFLERLFATQASWIEAEDPLVGLASVAKTGGMGQEQFDRCINDEQLAKRVTKSRHDAEQALVIENTPTFFINGRKLEGAHPFETFEEILNPLLSTS